MALSLSHLARAVVRLRCPVCLEGRVFRGLFETRPRCAVCGFFFSRESGYFLGSVYVGYAVTVLAASLTGLLLGRGAGMGWSPALLAILVGIVLVFPLWFLRYARMLWLAVDLYLNPPVREDFDPRGRTEETDGAGSRI